MNNDKLFTEFPLVSTEEWEALINKDLKGADYEKKLIWKTDEGFKVRPYYRTEDLCEIEYLNALPDEFPFTRGIKRQKNDWEIVQEINESEPVKANTNAIEAAQRGATTLNFNAKNIKSVFDLQTLLAGIDLENIGIFFKQAPDNTLLLSLFVNYLNTTDYDKKRVKGGIDFDPIIYRLKYKKFHRSQDEDFAEIKTLLEITTAMPYFKILNVNGLAIHNAGSTIVQELGYALGIANEYIAQTTANGIAVDQIVPKMGLTLSIGSNYFMEIAKLRAARLLWATMVEQYHPQQDTIAELHIGSVASSWNKTLYDPYVNILRTTTEGMAAAIGGADSITLKPFDVVYKEDDEFSRRISRNIQVILKEESFFDKVVDPAAGSYYVENLTDSIAEYAWKLFQHIEAEGGILKAIDSGEIVADIEKSCKKRDMDMATRKLILLGTNQYPNIGEAMLDKIEHREKEEYHGLKSYRGAEAFEELRLSTEKYTAKQGRPKVFLLKVGNISMRQARAGFITNFFGCAGYEILDNAGFSDINEGVNAAFDAKSNIVVLCSSDDEYATLGIEVLNNIKARNPEMICVVAGNPVEHIDLLKEAGAEDFVHVKTNVLESLRGYNQKLGID